MQTDAVSGLIVAVSDQVIWPRFGRLLASDVEEKAPGDPVTVADREAEVLLSQAILDADPDALVIGEEAVAADPSLLARLDAAPHVWLIDPVDGTANFASGNRDFGTMVVELRGGRPERSWIWQAGSRRLFVSLVGEGVFVTGAQSTATDRDESDRSALSVLQSRITDRAPWVGGVTPEYADLAAPGLAQPWPMTGSCTADYPAMALGERDYLVHNGRHPWDHYPGICLLTELGGKVAFADGEPYRTNSDNPWRLIAARTPDIWQAVADAVVRLGVR